MKHKLLLFSLLCLFTTSSYAALYTVNAGGTSFTPASGITMHPGDTIKWVWTDGTHTTTSTTIPGGATTWDHQLNASATVFIYIPTVVGVYHYQCTNHVSMGMTGTFTVVSATGISLVNNNANPMVSMYPNPSSVTVHLQFNYISPHTSVALTDINGKAIRTYEYNNVKEADLNLADIPKGIYTVSVKQGDEINKSELVVVH